MGHPAGMELTLGSRAARAGAPAPHTPICAHITFLDQAGADAAEEVFGVEFGLGQDFGLVAVFEGDLLEEQFDGVFGFEALGDEFADAGSEAVGVVGGTLARGVLGAFVVAEFGRCQAVIGGAGFGIVQEGGDGIIPIALRAGPSLERMRGRPDDFSCGVLFQFAVICSVVVHERDGSYPQLAWPLRNALGQ